MEFYDLASRLIEGEGMKQYILQMKQEAESMKDTPLKLVVGGVTGGNIDVEEIEDGYPESQNQDENEEESMRSFIEEDMY